MHIGKPISLIRKANKDGRWTGGCQGLTKTGSRPRRTTIPGGTRAANVRATTSRRNKSKRRVARELGFPEYLVCQVGSDGHAVPLALVSLDHEEDPENKTHERNEPEEQDSQRESCGNSGETSGDE